MIPKIVHICMVGETDSVKAVLAYFLEPILSKIDRELTRESLINLYHSSVGMQPISRQTLDEDSIATWNSR